MSERWSCFCPSLFETEAETFEVAVHGLLVKVLGHKVGRVVLASDLDQIKVLGAHLLLDPKVRHGQVANPAEALSAAYPDGRRRVSQDAELEGQAQIGGEGAKANALRSPLANAG